MTRPSYSRPYCLICYAVLSEFRGASTHCSCCGGVNLRIDLQRLWTREPRVLTWEWALKALVLALCVGVGALALFHPGFGVGRGQGMAIGAPIVIGVILWDLVSLSQRESSYRSSIIWPVIGLIFGLPATAVFSIALSNGWSLSAILLSGAASAIFFAAMLTPYSRKRWLRWRDERVATRQLAASD